MKKVYIQLGGAVVLFIIAIVGYMVWYGEVSAESGQVGGIEQQIQEKSQATSRIAQAKAQLTQLAPEEDSVDGYFISTNNIVTFLEQLASTGQFLGANVQVVSVSATPGTSHGTLNLSLTVTGSFDAVMRTLGSIEYGPYDVRTTSVTLGETGTASSTAAWEATGIFVIGMQSGTQQPTIAPVDSTTASSSQALPPVPTASSSQTQSATPSV